MKNTLIFFAFFLLNNMITAQPVAVENNLIVKRDGTQGIDCDFSGNRAIQDAIESIKDASANNRYEVIVYPGIYQATSTKDFNSEGSGEGNYAFIRGKDFVSIRGTNRDSVIIRGILPNNLGENFSYASYQTLFWNANKASIVNATITAQNLRYPIHLDGGQKGMANAYTKFSNVKIIHYGNTGDATNWKSDTPLGLGMSDGQVLVVENSSLYSNSRWALYMHTNKNFQKKSKLVFTNCKFIGEGKEGNNVLGCFQSLGSKRQDEIILQNCSWDKAYVIHVDDWPYLSTGVDEQSYNHCDLNVHGFGNSMFLWSSIFRGFALKIISKSDGGTVRFDSGCSAFPLIISEDKSIESQILFNNEVNKDGYSYRDGKKDIKSYAIGHLDVGEEKTYDNKYFKSLGKRLGDCSKKHKTLVVIIDGMRHEIVFDKNYAGKGLNNDNEPSAFSNAQIINEINSVIGDIAEVTLWAVGNDYYPEFSDCTDTVVAKENILNGMLVFKEKSGKIRKATKYDKKVYGVALDDIIENRMGRVLTRGYLLADKNQRFRILTDSNSKIEKGESIGISNIPGIASKSALNKLFVAKDNNIISIK